MNNGLDEIRFKQKDFEMIKTKEELNTVAEQLVALNRITEIEYFTIDVQNKESSRSSTKFTIKLKDSGSRGVSFILRWEIPKYYSEKGVTKKEILESILNSKNKIYFSYRNDYILFHKEKFPSQEAWYKRKEEEKIKKANASGWTPMDSDAIFRYAKDKVERDKKEVDELLKTNKNIAYENVNSRNTDILISMINIKDVKKEITTSLSPIIRMKSYNFSKGERYEKVVREEFSRSIFNYKPETAKKKIDEVIERLYDKTPFGIIRRSAKADKVVLEFREGQFITTGYQGWFTPVREEDDSTTGINFRTDGMKTKTVKVRRKVGYRSYEGIVKLLYDTSLEFINLNPNKDKSIIQNLGKLAGIERYGSEFYESKTAFLSEEVRLFGEIFNEERGEWVEAPERWRDLSVNQRYSNVTTETENEAKRVFGIPENSVIVRIKISFEQVLDEEDNIDADEILKSIVG